MKKLFLTFSVALFVYIGLCLNVNAETYGDLTYEISDGEVTITGCSESAVSVNIPASIDGCPVTQIGNYAFTDHFGLAIASVTIPDSVTIIGEGAFQDCYYLTSVDIGDNVESIGFQAFYDCENLTSITIPDSVTSIDSCAFLGCEKLTNITIPNGVSYIGGSVFYNTEYYNNASNWENDVLYMGNHLIEAKTSIIGSYIIKDGTKCISSDAFKGCTALTNITIPSSVISIGGGTFSGCTSLTSITIPDGVTKLYGHTFDGCTSLTSLTIPDSVTSIGDYAFRNCENIKSLYITDIKSWLEIDFGYDPPLYNASGVSLYINGESATEIVIPDGVTSIPSAAFSGCTNITSITIPDSVTDINYAFVGCTGLKKIIVGKGITTLQGGIFRGCSSIEEITLPFVGRMRDDESPWGDAVFGHIFSVGNKSPNAGGIGQLYYSSNLIYYHIPTTLKKVTITDETVIPDGAFSNCSMLKNISLPDSVTSIGDYAFYGCKGLASVTIGNSVETIGHDAFKNCINLTSITIPNSVTLIGGSAFDGCTSLSHLVIPDSVTFIGAYTFRNCSSLTNITIGNGVTSIGYNAFNNCRLLTSITIPNSVTSIDSDAFINCSSLTSITIPNSVTRIAYQTFAGCSSLTSITIPNGVTNIDYGAFGRGDNLKDIYYFGTKPEWESIQIGNGNEKLTSATIHYLGDKKVNLDTPQIVPLGKTATATATYTESGTTTTEGITFTCSDTSILQMTASGNTATLKGLKPGKVTITATHTESGTSASAEITVGEITVELEKEEFDLMLDSEEKYVYRYYIKCDGTILSDYQPRIEFKLTSGLNGDIAEITDVGYVLTIFELKPKTPGFCELIAYIDGEEKARAKVNVTADVIQAINNESVLKAKVLLNNSRYKYYRDNDSIHHVHVSKLGLGTSVFYQNIGNYIGMLLESRVTGDSINDINAKNAYKAVLCRLLYGGEAYDKQLDYVTDVENYFIKYAGMVESGGLKGLSVTPDNIADFKKTFAGLPDNMMGYLDTLLVVGKSADACYRELSMIYSLTQCSEQQIIALSMIAAETPDENLRKACLELAEIISDETEAKIGNMLVSGSVTFAKTAASEIMCSIIQKGLDFIPGVKAASMSMDATKLALNSIFNVDDSAEDLINLCALQCVENALYSSMLNAQNAFSADQNYVNAVKFMSCADFYKEILFYGIDIVESLANHNEKQQIVLNAGILNLKALFDSEKDLVDVVNSFYEEKGINAQYECIRVCRAVLGESDFYSAEGIDIVEYLREVKSTTPSDWAKPEIDKAIEIGLLPDYMRNNYQSNITRAEFCTLMTQFVFTQLPSPTYEELDKLIWEKGALIKSKFSDTFYEYVDYAYKLGIVNGVSEDEFMPLGEITREQAATMLYRAALLFDKNDGSKDISSGFEGVSSWAREGVNFVAANGIMQGTDKGFEPQGTFTKEQAIATLVRMYEKFPDIPTLVYLN